MLAEQHDPRYLVLHVLSLLRYAYSLRSLEEALGVPAQVLWRYTRLIAVPEKETARRLLALIGEKRLLEDALRDRLCSTCPAGVVEEAGLWGLAGFMAAQVLRAKVSEKPRLVVASPWPSSLLFASAVARELHSALAFSTLGLGPSRGAYTEPVECDGILTVVSVPRSLVQRGSAIIVSASLPAGCGHQVVKTLSELLAHHGARVIALLSLCPIEAVRLENIPLLIQFCNNT